MAKQPKKNEHLFFNALPDFEKEAEAEMRRRNAPKAPSFSLEDMEEARKSSFAKGREEGLQIAKDAIEQRTEVLIHSLVDRINDLEKAEDLRHTNAIDNSIAIAFKAVTKLMPKILNDYKKPLILDALDNFFTDHINKHTLTLYTHPSMQDAVGRHVKNLSPSITIETDDTMTDDQVRLEWKDGSFEFKPDAMVDKIIAILKGHLHENSESLDESTKKTHNNEIDDNTKDSHHE